jgi:hypothetical protein
MGTLKFSEGVRNGQNDSIETVIGASPVLKIRSGSAPATIASPDAGTVLATIDLPSDWMAPSAGAVKSKSGVWQDTSADADGTAAHFRIYASDGITPHIQGTVTQTGGGGDMTVDNVVIAAGQTVIVTGFTFTAGNA